MPYDEVDKLARSANGSILYAATASGGVYQSTDQAANWTPLRTGYQGLVIRIFAFQPGSSVVLAGSSGQPGIGGVYRSTDGGTTWAPSSSGMNTLGIRGIAFAPAPNTNIVLAAGGAQQKIGGEFNKGVWRSTDGGVTWTSITSGLAQGYKRIVLFDPNNANHVMMSSRNGIIVSADAGLTWAYPTNGLPDQVAGSGAYVLGIAVGPGPTSGTTRFYAAFEDDNPPSPPPPPGAEGGVYYSDDGGNTWTASASPANGGLPDDSAAYFSVSPTAGTLYVSKINVGQVGRASGVFKSTDYGVHWQDSTNNLTCTYVAAYADQVDANVVWAPCGGGGLFRSNDGGASWAPYDIGLRNKSILWMSIDPANSNNILAGGYEGIDQMNYAPDADQDGIPDSVEKAAAGGTGDGNLDGIPDYTQANVASTPLGTTVTPAAKTSVRAATTATDYVVVELDQSAAHTGTCQLVSDLVVVPSDQIPISNRMVQAAPTISFILPNCQSATVNIRYSANTSYPVGVFGSYSPIAPGDAITQWGLLQQGHRRQRHRRVDAATRSERLRQCIRARHRQHPVPGCTGQGQHFRQRIRLIGGGLVVALRGSVGAPHAYKVCLHTLNRGYDVSYACRFAAVLAFASLSSLAVATESTNTWYLRGPYGGYAAGVAIDSVTGKVVAGGNTGVFRYPATPTPPALPPDAWEYAASGLPPDSGVVDLVATPAPVLYLNSYNGLFASTDGGMTWTSAAGGLPAGQGVGSITAPAASPLRVYASIYGIGVYRSDTKGNSWLPTATQPARLDLTLVRTSPTNANLVFAASDVDANGVANLYRSADGGASWTAVLASPGNVDVPQQIRDVAQDPERCQSPVGHFCSYSVHDTRRWRRHNFRFPGCWGHLVCIVHERACSNRRCKYRLLWRTARTSVRSRGERRGLRR